MTTVPGKELSLMVSFTAPSDNTQTLEFKTQLKIAVWLQSIITTTTSNNYKEKKNIWFEIYLYIATHRTASANYPGVSRLQTESPSLWYMLPHFLDNMMESPSNTFFRHNLVNF